jgi:Xaa-Pro aminopeptidase
VAEAPWQKGSEREPSYVGEVVTHQYTLYGLLSSLAAGSLLAGPYPLGIASLPLVLFSGALGLALVFVPSSSRFRHWVNARQARERREGIRAHLTSELEVRQMGDHPHWATYQRLCERIASLRALSRDKTTAIGESDIDKLDDATLDYLGLWLAGFSMSERYETLRDQDLEQRIERVAQQIAEARSADRVRLEKARVDLQRLLRSRERIESHSTALEANMLSMADAIEEVYQGVIQNPTASDARAQVQAAVERIRIEEDLSAALEEDLVEVLPRSSQLNVARKTAAEQRT